MFKPVLNLMLLFCFIAGMVLLGCAKPEPPAQVQGNVQRNGATPPVPIGEVNILQPPAQGTDGKIYARGVASSQMERLSMSMATQDARRQLAEQCKVYVSALTKDFVGQVGPAAKAQLSAVFTQVSDSFTNETLIGVRQEKSRTSIMSDGTYRSEVILSLTQTTVDSSVEQEISKDEALYQEFKATQAHAELQARKEAERQRSQ